MFKNIIIGQYFAGTLLLHRLNPAVKIAFALIYIFVLFFIKNPLSYILFTAYTLSLILISSIPVKSFLRG